MEEMEGMRRMERYSEFTRAKVGLNLLGPFGR